MTSVYDTRNPALWLGRGTLYNHYSQCNEMDRHEHFSFEGDTHLACPHCGEFYYHADSMERLERFRGLLGLPVYLSSGHRCAFYNAAKRGAVRSAHKFLAFDIRLYPEREIQLAMAGALREVGFHGFGFATGFIHVDMARPRFWTYGPESDKLWASFIRRHYL